MIILPINALWHTYLMYDVKIVLNHYALRKIFLLTSNIKSSLISYRLFPYRVYKFVETATFISLIEELWIDDLESNEPVIWNPRITLGDDRGIQFLYKWKQTTSPLPWAKVNGVLPAPICPPHMANSNFLITKRNKARDDKHDDSPAIGCWFRSSYRNSCKPSIEKTSKWSFYSTTWSHNMQDNSKLEVMEIFIEWLNHCKCLSCHFHDTTAS